MNWNRSPRASSRWSLTVGLVAIGLLAGVGGAFYLSLPAVTDFYPAADAPNVSARAPVRLAFNRPMNPASVEAALQLAPAVPGLMSWEGNTLTFTPVAAWPHGETVSVTLGSGAQSAQGLPLQKTVTWIFSVRPPSIAFLYDAPPNLWLQALTEEARPQPVTTETGGVADFDLSPDGQRFVYAVRRPDGGADLRSIDADGANAADLRLCPQAACLAPAFSPDGRRLAYERQSLAGATRIHLYTFATGVDETLGDEANNANSPHWLPDGRLSYYDTARQTTVVRNLDAGGVTYIPNFSAEPGAWTFDSQAFVFPEIFIPTEPVTVEAGLGEAPLHLYSRLLRVDVATNAVQNLSGADMLDDASPAFSPDGAWLAFGRKSTASVEWTPGRQLWLMRPDGREAHALTDEPVYNHSAFAWNAESSALVYMRFDPTELGRPAEIWLIQIDGSGARKLVAGGYRPQWLP